MSCNHNVHLYDTTDFNILPVTNAGVAVDISGATLYVTFTKPRTGTSSTVSGEPLVSGSNTYIHYTSPSGFLDEIGRWQIEGHILAGSGSWRTQIGKFTVQRIL